MANPLLGKVFSLGKSSGLKSIDALILFHIIYDNKTTIDQLAEKSYSSENTVLRSLRKLIKNEFIFNVKGHSKARNKLVVNQEKIEALWLSNYNETAKLEVLSKPKEERDPQIGGDETAKLEVLDRQIGGPLYNIINNLTIDLSNEIDDRKDNLVKLVDNKNKTEEELAKDWLANQIITMRKDDRIPLHISQVKDDRALIAEGMFHAINRNQDKFPKLSNALKGMLSLLEQGIWHTPTGMLQKKAEAIREVRVYDKEPRPESIVDINYQRPEEEKTNGLKNLAEMINILRKKGGGIALNTH